MTVLILSKQSKSMKKKIQTRMYHHVPYHQFQELHPFYFLHLGKFLLHYTHAHQAQNHLQQIFVHHVEHHLVHPIVPHPLVHHLEQHLNVDLQLQLSVKLPIWVKTTTKQLGRNLLLPLLIVHQIHPPARVYLLPTPHC